MKSNDTIHGDPARQALDEAIVAWMAEEEWRDEEERFNELALRLFAHQFEHCDPYQRFCLRRGATPNRVETWRDIPPVPTGAFKEIALRSFASERTVQTFRTSGTSTERRGELHLDTLRLYEASLVPSFRRFVLPDLEAGRRAPNLRFLASSPMEAPDSSLSYMFGHLCERLAGSGSGFDVIGGELHADALIDRMAEASDSVTLCGTAFAFVHLCDALSARNTSLQLPEGSRAMETGGFKGQGRNVSRDDLHTALENRLGIPIERIVNQYGMTELGSQFHDSSLRDRERPRRKLGPPWTRVLIVDPDTGRPSPPGQPGYIVIFDLANTSSVLAIQTADLGRGIENGFEIIGRDPEAEARGCSIAADELLSDNAR
ncbi:AMP-binding protein [Myxococcota bacterium]|nr:AMP-binding protein [Myxococcota bacterium]